VVGSVVGRRVSGVTTSTDRYLPGQSARARLMRMESASILKRFFFCEEALIRGMAGWLAAIEPLDLKLLLPRAIWEDAQTAEALRVRVFELHYPSRLMEIGEDAPLVDLFEAARHAPNVAAYLLGAVHVLLPALVAGYRAYLEAADDISDGPTKRFLDLAVAEKDRQIAELTPHIDALLANDAATRDAAAAWSAALQGWMDALGGIQLTPPLNLTESLSLPGARPFTLIQQPGSDPRFHRGRFYWPDNVDPSYGYGEGITLQLRSAVSHLNEVWAVETAGVILEAFAQSLGWEFVADAARWVYDESRHCRMGLTRLRDWGFADAELPVGSFIYDSARGQDPLYRMGMLFYFETKNIGKKTKRTESFAGYGDVASQHDMDFDWADEGMHAAYGKRWLTALIAERGLPPETFDAVREKCGDLVDAVVATATPKEIADIRSTVDRLIAHAVILANTG
jgi:hypothetical protein